jgi:hypothetical protein
MNRRCCENIDAPMTTHCGPSLRTAIALQGLLGVFLGILSWTIPCLSAFGVVAVQIGQNFTASTQGVDSTARVPDAGLAVGTNYLTQFINGRYSVFNKTNGAKVQTMTDRNFWANAGIALTSNIGMTDPRICFDKASQRWFALMVDFKTNSTVAISNRFFLGVSATADPSGIWRAIAFPADPTNGYFADFPTLGIDAEAVYLGAQMFDASGYIMGQTLVSIPKIHLLANPPTTSGQKLFGILNSTTYGWVLQPVVTQGAASTAETVLALGDLGYDGGPHSTLIAFGVGNGSISGGAFLTSPSTLTVPIYWAPSIPLQPNGLANLDAGDTRLSATVYRVGDIIYAVHSTSFDYRNAIQWVVINATTLQVMDTGIILDPHLDLFYPAIAANASGTMVIVCNGCSISSFLSCYAITAEKVNETRTFGSLVLLKSGASFTGAGRWGDYSAVSVDPVDPNRFWALTMYPSANTKWSTQITELNTASVQLKIAKAGTNVVVSWPSAATGFQLQSRTDLGAGVWSAVPGSPVLTNNQYIMSLASTGAVQFFRLTK